MTITKSQFIKDLKQPTSQFANTYLQKVILQILESFPDDIAVGCEHEVSSQSIIGDNLHHLTETTDPTVWLESLFHLLNVHDEELLRKTHQTFLFMHALVELQTNIRLARGEALLARTLLDSYSLTYLSELKKGPAFSPFLNTLPTVNEFFWDLGHTLHTNLYAFLTDDHLEKYSNIIVAVKFAQVCDRIQSEMNEIGVSLINAIKTQIAENPEARHQWKERLIAPDCSPYTIACDISAKWSARLHTESIPHFVDAYINQTPAPRILSTPLPIEEKFISPPTPLLHEINHEYSKFLNNPFLYKRDSLNFISHSIGIDPSESKSVQRFGGFKYETSIGTQRYKFFRDIDEKNQYLNDAKLALELQIEEFKKHR